MAMISGLSGRKSSTGSPTSPLNAEKLESEEMTWSSSLSSRRCVPSFP
uniref:Myosin light chain kinase n=1 Tax=Homo sapiens TaxID=9606 RepID=A0A8I5KZ33_HUMAN